MNNQLDIYQVCILQNEGVVADEVLASIYTLYNDWGSMQGFHGGFCWGAVAFSYIL